MDFNSAEAILNSALLYGNTPLAIVGPNGIGKTELLKTLTSQFKKTAEYTTGFDYGGLTQFLQTKRPSVKTIVLSDLQRVLTRKQPVRQAALGLMSSLVEEGVQNELSFNRLNATGDKKVNLNFIIGCTPIHISQLIAENYNDMLDRFAFIIVNRNADEIDFTKPFHLQRPVIKVKHHADHTPIRFKDNPRHNVLLNNIIHNLKGINAHDTITDLATHPIGLFHPNMLNRQTNIFSENITFAPISLPTATEPAVPGQATSPITQPGGQKSI